MKLAAITWQPIFHVVSRWQKRVTIILILQFVALLPPYAGLESSAIMMASLGLVVEIALIVSFTLVHALLLKGFFRLPSDANWLTQ